MKSSYLVFSFLVVLLASKSSASTCDGVVDFHPDKVSWEIQVQLTYEILTQLSSRELRELSKILVEDAPSTKKIAGGIFKLEELAASSEPDISKSLEEAVDDSVLSFSEAVLELLYDRSNCSSEGKVLHQSAMTKHRSFTECSGLGTNC